MIIVIFCDFTIRFTVSASQACSVHALLSGTTTSCTVSSILAILAPSHGSLYCYDIARYIVTLAILVGYRHVGIDDKYRGIAQH